MSSTTLLGRLAGIERIEAQLQEQNRATELHRQYEGDALRALQAETGEIKTLALKTNGRVNAHDVELAVIAKAEDQALVIEAARVKAAETAKASHVSLKQGLQVAAFSLLGGSVVTTLVYLLLGLSTH